MREGGTPAQREVDLSACRSPIPERSFHTLRQKDLDILFLIDNSSSMAPLQQALARNIPRLIQAIEATGANYHIGVATSDVGSYVAPGRPWP